VQQNRPPMPPPPPNMVQNGHPPMMSGGGGGGGGIINLGPTRGKSPAARGKSPAPMKRRGSKKYHDFGSDDSDPYDSAGSDSASTRSSSNDTSISTHSRGGHRTGRRYSHTKPQNRSYSRHRPEQSREHRKRYIEAPRDPPPQRQFEDLPSPLPIRPTFAPEINRGNPAAGFDPVAAAYQAGKMDADAERFGLHERERYIPPPRPIERPVVHQVIEQPRPVVSYVRREIDAGHPASPTRIVQTRYSPTIISPRFGPDRFIEAPRGEYRDFRPEPREFRGQRDFRSEYRDDFESEGSMSPPPPRFDYQSRERDAEEYIERERPSFGRRATEPRIISTSRNDPNPFAALPHRRRYPPSMSTADSMGW
jgi:hypothetical protein